MWGAVDLLGSRPIYPPPPPLGSVPTPSVLVVPLYPGLWGLAWDDAKRTRRLGTGAHPPTVRVTTAVTNRLPHGYSALGEQGRTGELFMALTPALSVQTLLSEITWGAVLWAHPWVARYGYISSL